VSAADDRFVEAVRIAHGIAGDNTRELLAYIAGHLYVTGYPQASIELAAIAGCTLKLPPAGEWLIWSNEHRGYWRGDQLGYTEEVSEAGRFSLVEAIEICERASFGSRGVPNETMLPAAAVPKRPRSAG
jgi:hypothetical protein